jgi:hypothetical protein
MEMLHSDSGRELAATSWPHDRDSVLADPLFVDPAHSDFFASGSTAQRRSCVGSSRCSWTTWGLDHVEPDWAPPSFIGLGVGCSSAQHHLIGRKCANAGRVCAKPIPRIDIQGLTRKRLFFSFAFAQGAGGAASSWLRVATGCRLTGQPCSSFLFITCACSRQCVVYHRARRRASPAVSSDRTWGGVCVLLLRGEAGGAKREARERAEPRALDPGSSAGCWCCPLALAGCLPWPLIGRSATWKPTVGLNSASWLPFGWLVRLLPSAPETQFQFLAGSWLARVGALKARPFALALEGN